MSYDIRKISLYFNEVHSRYFIDTNCCVYTSLGSNAERVMVDGKYIRVVKFRNRMLSEMNNSNKLVVPIPETKNKYFMMNDGTILRRLSTRMEDNGAIDVSLIRVFGGSDRGNRYLLHRLMAGCFIGNIGNMEIHHIDGNRKNNRLNNLKIMTLEDHRGKGNYIKNHKIACND